MAFEKNILSVRQLNNYIKNLLQGDSLLSSLWVQGEISNFKLHSSGHMYFTLKDNDSSLKCVMFKGNNRRLDFSPEHGMHVIALGYVSVYDKTGQYQFYVDSLLPHGKGVMNLKYEKLKKDLSDEGLFDIDRKRELPFFPDTVGIVTSLTGAALRDIITIIKRRSPRTKILVSPAIVQGEQAKNSIYKALDKLYNENVSVIVIGRGGGSLEELWCFNEEMVVRKISESPVPIVSAVGHETDFTLSDFASDKRAATPSMAAELVVPDIIDLKKQIISYQKRLNLLISDSLLKEKQRSSALRQTLLKNNPDKQISIYEEKLKNFYLRFTSNIKKKYMAERHEFLQLANKLDSLSPLKTLSRGYSVCFDKNEKVLTSVDQIDIGEPIKVMLNKGYLLGKVSEKKVDD